MTVTPNQYIFFSNKEKKKQEKKTNSHWVQTPFNIQSLKKKVIISINCISIGQALCKLQF